MYTRQKNSWLYLGNKNQLHIVSTIGLVFTNTTYDQKRKIIFRH